MIFVSADDSLTSLYSRPGIQDTYAVLVNYRDPDYKSCLSKEQRDEHKVIARQWFKDELKELKRQKKEVVKMFDEEISKISKVLR